jgi:hypothetical protein
VKVAVQCESPLLQKSLELFLKDSLSSVKNCDVVVRDKKVLDTDHITLVIGNDSDCQLQKPFSKSQLFMAIENILDKKEQKVKVEPEPKSAKKADDLDILERRIFMLTQEYQNNIMKAIRAFYEK